PAMRNLAATDGQTMVDEAYREHQQVKDLLNDLDTMDPASEAFDTKFAEFKNKIEHHVEEEEGEMFPILIERMSIDRQEELGRRIHHRKMDLKTRLAAQAATPIAKKRAVQYAALRKILKHLLW